MRKWKSRRRGRLTGFTAAAAVLIFMTAILALPVRGEETNGRLSLRLGGGASLFSWGDVESLRESYRGQILYGASQMGIEATGSCQNPKLGGQMEVEVRYDLTPRIGLAFAFGLNRRSGETVMTANWPPFMTSRHVWNQATSLTTFLLNATWSLPLNPRSAAYLTAGAGLGSAIWKYKIRDEETIDLTVWEQLEGRARDQGLLLQAGIGYEFKMAEKWLLFAEIRGQLLSLKDWGTEQTASTDADPEGDSSGTEEGKLWLAEIAGAGGKPDRAILLASLFIPDSRPYDGVRAFRLNFSGVVFQAGIRFKFGPRPMSSDERRLP